MPLTLEPLPWDSEHFGASIAKVTLDGATPAELEAVDVEARDLGIECIYGILDPADGLLSQQVQSRGWRFIEAATLFDLRVAEPSIPRPADTDFRIGTLDDVPQLTPIVDEMSKWSRFAVDPRFGLDAAKRLQRAWLDRAARADTGQHSLVVAEQEGDIVAFTGRVAEPPRVDAVGTTRRGSGAARYLIEEARGWAGDRSLLGGPIAARNIATLRYVSHCNYRVCQVEYIYHRWLDETPRALG